MRLILIRPVCCRSRSSTDSVRLADSTSAPTGRRRCAWPDAADARDGEHAVLASATSVRRRGHYDWFVRVRPPGARRVRRLLLLEEVRRAAQLHVPLSCMSHSAFGLGLCLSCVPPGTARHADVHVSDCRRGAQTPVQCVQANARSILGAEPLCVYTSL